MAWLPDWENMQTAEYSIVYTDENNVQGETECLPVSIEGDQKYRLLEQPLFNETLTWGDLIKAREMDESTLELLEIIEHAEDTREDSLIGGQVTLTNDDMFLGRLMADGGFWQQDAMGLLTIFYPPGKSEEDYRD